MKNAETSKREKLSGQLKAASESLPHTERMMWAIKNNMSLYTVNRYLNGAVGSTIIAEKLLADIAQFVKSGKLAA